MLVGFDAAVLYFTIYFLIAYKDYEFVNTNDIKVVNIKK